MLNISCGYASTQYTVNEEPLSFPIRHHQASSLQGHTSAPWLRVEALRRAGNKSSIIVLLYEDRWILGILPTPMTTH